MAIVRLTDKYVRELLSRFVLEQPKKDSRLIGGSAATATINDPKAKAVNEFLKITRSLVT